MPTLCPFFCRVLFGNLVEIRADRYASIIDTAPPQTYIVMHIYDEVRLSCATPTSNPSLLSSSPSYPVSAVLSESKPSTYTVGKDLSCGMGVWWECGGCVVWGGGMGEAAVDSYVVMHLLS